jgi:D-ornithine 4,5-aminomutase subunit alpha
MTCWQPSVLEIKQSETGDHGMVDDRIARYEERRKELQQMTDQQLKAHFWELCDQLVAPLVDLARTHTSPSIERAVLLRMGIDSLSSQGVVEHIFQAGLLGKGAGHVLLKLAEKQGTDVKSAAQAILENKDVLQGLFSEPLRSGG